MKLKFTQDDVLAEARVAMQIRLRQGSTAELAYTFVAACWLPEWQQATGKPVTVADFAEVVKGMWLGSGNWDAPAEPRFASRMGTDKLFWKLVYSDQRRDLNPMVAQAIARAPLHPTFEEICKVVARQHRQTPQFVSKALRSYTTLGEWRYIRATCFAQVESPSGTTVFDRAVWPVFRQELGKHPTLHACKVAALAKLGPGSTSISLDGCASLAQVEEVRTYYPGVMGARLKKLSAAA